MSACKQRAKSILCSRYIVSFTHHNYFYLGKNFWLETTNWFQPSKRQCEINWSSLHEKWEERRSFSEAWHSKQLFHTLTAESRILEDIYTKGIKPATLKKGTSVFSILFLAKTHNRLQRLRKKISYLFFFSVHAFQDLWKKFLLKGSFSLEKTFYKVFPGDWFKELILEWLTFINKLLKQLFKL